MRTSRATTGRWVTLLAGALLLGACGADGSDASTGPTAGDGPGTTSLEVTPSKARCAVPSVEGLRSQDTAFEGTVTQVRDGRAVLDVDAWYVGEESEQVTVSTPSKELTDLLLAVDFRKGATYLVSASEGRVSLCGLSAEKDRLLTDLYAEAYGS